MHDKAKAPVTEKACKRRRTCKSSQKLGTGGCEPRDDASQALSQTEHDLALNPAIPSDLAAQFLEGTPIASVILVAHNPNDASDALTPMRSMLAEALRHLETRQAFVR